MADERAVSGDQGQTAPNRDGAPQAQQEASRRAAVPAPYEVDTSDKEAAHRSAQVWTVPANSDVENGDEFNEFQRKANEPEENQ